MNILTRISRLFKADIHGILDSLEKPEIILKQAVRDMQDEIDKATISISAFTHQQESLQQKQQSLSEHIQTQQQQLDFCFSENNTDLCKSVIRKKLQAELSLKELNQLLTNISEEKQKHITETDERKEKLQAIRDKLALFTEQTEINGAPPVSSPNSTVSQDDIELAFLYEKQHYAETHNKGEVS